MAAIQADQNTTPRVGIIGCGNIASRWDENDQGKSAQPGKTHAKVFSRNPACQLVAVFDQDLVRANDCAKFWDITFATNHLEKFLEKKPDIICICTPENFRLSILEKITAPQGTVIVCEKPLAPNISEVEKIIDLCKEKNWKLITNFVRSFGTGFKLLNALIQSNEMGTIEKILGNYGKGLRNNGSHMIQAILEFAGTPDSAEILSILKDDRIATNDPTANVLMNFYSSSGNFNAYLSANDHRNYSVFELDIFFSKGRVRVSDRGHLIEIFSTTDDTSYPGYKILKFDRALPSGLDNHFENLATYALELFKGNTNNSMKLGSVVLTHKIIDSLQTRGKYVSI